MPKTHDPKRKHQNLVARSDVIKNRMMATAQFSGNDELRRLGLLIIQFSEVGEVVSLSCQILMIRPELGGFVESKPVIEKGFSEKLEYCRKLCTAIGVLHGISTAGVETALEEAKALGEDRNCVVHGALKCKQGQAEPVFHRQGREIPATSTSLRNLSLRCLQVCSMLAGGIGSFNQQLPDKAPAPLSGGEALIQKAFASMKTSFESRQRAFESTTQVEESKKQLAKSKAKARASRARLRRAEGKLMAALGKEPSESPQKKKLVERVSDLLSIARSQAPAATEDPLRNSHRVPNAN